MDTATCGSNHEEIPMANQARSVTALVGQLGKQKAASAKQAPAASADGRPKSSVLRPSARSKSAKIAWSDLLIEIQELIFL
jgi:hypothetical protein